MILFFYNLILNLLSPLFIFTIIFRVFLGKEDKVRFIEKLGFSLENRIKKKVIWFHACSVGEVKSISILIDEFLKVRCTILVTTSTLLSSNYVKKNFSKKVRHQFLPIDFNFSTNSFLNRWDPCIGIFVESEIWPNLIFNCKKKNIPLMLIQASFSNTTLKKWTYCKSFFKKLISNFKIIIAQSKQEEKKLYNFANIKIHSIYNLKNSSKVLNINNNEILKIKEQIKDYFFISALSTHNGEEEIVLKSIKKIIKKLDKVILIIQPRHPQRSGKIRKIIKKYDFNIKQRSLNEYPEKSTKVYLADTFGESGTLIALSDLIILGGTLTPVGGHNIIEPAQFSKCIILGEYCSKIQDTVNILKKYKAVKQINTNSKLSELIYQLYNDKKEIKNIGKKAFSITRKFPSKEKNIVNQIISLANNENSKILVQK